MTTTARATGTATAVEQLLGMWSEADPWNYDSQEIAPLQLSALRERFTERRAQLRGRKFLFLIEVAKKSVDG